MDNTLDLKMCMEKLAGKCPVFHSEFDFQFALAWEIKEEYGNAEIRMEQPLKYDEPVYDEQLKATGETKETTANIDIVVHFDKEMIPIELKYLKTESKFEVNGEVFNLKSHGGAGTRYDCIKDIQRIEGVLANNGNTNKGYTIWLGNRDYCFRHKDDESFNISEGEKLAGEVKWANEEARKKVSPSRQNSITLKNTYTLNWVNYFNDSQKDKYKEFLKQPHSEFKYCLTEIGE